MVAVAIGTAVAGAVGAGASISASNKAAKTAKSTAATNNALQQDIYNQNKAALAPYQDGGKATASLNALLGLGGDTASANAAFDAYKGSTEYTSRLAQGSNSVQAALGGKGLLDSGAGQKSLLKYGQTFASNEFGNYVGNLQTQQQTGLAAASAQAGVGANYANSVSANNNAASTTVSNAALSNAGAINSALGSAVSAYGVSQGMGSSYGSKAALANGNNICLFWHLLDIWDDLARERSRGSGIRQRGCSRSDA